VKAEKDIEALLEWAYREQHIEAAVRQLMPTLGGGSTVSGLLQVLELGTRIDSSSAGERFAGVRCHEDAAVIYDAVQQLARAGLTETAGLLTLHARVGTRPDWCPGEIAEQVPVLDKRGNHKKLYRDQAKQRGFLGYAWEWSDGNRPDKVAHFRAQWTAWRLGLADVAKLVNGELSAFHATGPAVAAEPWAWEPAQALQSGA